MRGLPYDASAKQVTDFFVDGDNSCRVLDDESGVLFVKKPDGKATGDAFVLFEREEDAEIALKKHKRYHRIQIYRIIQINNCRSTTGNTYNFRH